jgi:2,4-dienoyl-CoA reductase-like NADH-dependent reductase (Old Yellow Enzyme family)
MHLLRRIERYLKSSGTAATRFGREAVRDPRLVHDLRRGREPGSAMSARLSTYLDTRETQVGS